MKKIINNYEALAKRVDKNQIKRDYDFIASLQYFTDVFNAISTVSVVLSETRQIVYVSNDFFERLGVSDSNLLLGYRIGEVLSCVHSAESSDGCGTSPSCLFCGALQAILESQNDLKKSKKECRITSNIKNKIVAWDFSVIATPLVFEKRRYSLVTINDVSAEKFKENIEKVFLHDLVNVAGRINGLSSLLDEVDDENEKNDFIQGIITSSQELLDQIVSHRELNSAESGDLVLNNNNEITTVLLESAIKITTQRSSDTHRVVIAPDSESITISTDLTLISRILINMIKNAIEANTDDSKIFIGAKHKNDKIRFWVQSEQLIPEEIKSNIFQRSFSTKGIGRGFGTFSMKLLGESYLKGDVGFTSDITNKTIFYLDLPSNIK